MKRSKAPYLSYEIDQVNEGCCVPGLLPCFSDFDFDFSSDFGLFRVVSSLWLARFVVAHDLFL